MLQRPGVIIMCASYEVIIFCGKEELWHLIDTRDGRWS